MERFVTVDETWVHYYQPETKQQSKQWKHVSSPPPKKAKSSPSAGKVMATVFWDSKGILMTDYLDKGFTINGQYYASLLSQLKTAIKSKRPGKLKKGVLFHQDNAPAHKSTVAMATIHHCGYKLIEHPPYSPDLAPSDYHLFPNLKKNLSGKKFQTDDEVKSAVNEFFDCMDKSFFFNGIKSLQHRWTKCVELRGDYVEK